MKIRGGGAHLSEATCRPACGQSGSAVLSSAKWDGVPTLLNKLAFCGVARLVAALAFPPVSPYQLLERVDADVVGVHVLHGDIALLEISLVNLVRVPRAGGQQQHDDDDGAIGAVWVRRRGVGRGPNGFRFAATEVDGRGWLCRGDGGGGGLWGRCAVLLLLLRLL